MTRSARLTSVDAVARLLTTMKIFGEDVASALDDLDMQVNRIREWISHERKHYWGEQVRKLTTAVSEAKVTLERARMFKIGDERPSCREEKDALAQTQRRLEEAQDKVAKVRHWGHALDHELREFRGGLSQLVTWLQADHPRAVAQLQRMIEALDLYVGVEPLPEARDTATLLGGPSATLTASRGTAEEPTAAKSNTPTPPEEWSAEPGTQKQEGGVQP